MVYLHAMLFGLVPQITWIPPKETSHVENDRERLSNCQSYLALVLISSCLVKFLCTWHYNRKPLLFVKVWWDDRPMMRDVVNSAISNLDTFAVA